MPRTERPLDCEDTELGRFAADLRKLREKAGKPSYRALASRAHYSAATLSDAAGGKKLPSLAVTLAYVKACGGDEEEWEQRWRDIAAPPEPTGEAPYVGLKAFQKEDADRFHGREKLTAKLVELTHARPFVGVFGASGSGKSSLLRAGLLPRLDQALIFTPGVQPLDECAVRLAQLTGHSAVVLHGELTDPAALGLLIRQHDENLVLVVDQFEEVFTLVGPEQRDWFVRALMSAPHVVIGVRADFYGHVGRHPELVEALEGAQLLVGPLTTDELRRAIVEPALRVGATVESALVTRLVADVVGQAAALPLVQHALVETWHRRRGMTLSLVGYEEAGGVEHAIARTAEAVYEQLDQEQQRIAQRTFLRLIALGEGTEDTKRRANRESFDADVLEHLANARLVTLTEQHAELTHEALIRSWPRLRDWIAEDRETLRVHHQLTEAAAQWDGDRDLLYQGARLAQAAELSADSLTEPEREFLTASQAEGRRRVRRARAVMAVLSVLVLLLAGTVVFAMRQADEVAAQRDIAVAGNAAAEARWLARMSMTEPDAARLALAVYRVSPTEANRDLLLKADAADRRKPYLSASHGSQINKADGGTLYAVTEQGRTGVSLWDLPANRMVVNLPGVPVAVSEDNSRAVLHGKENFGLYDSSPAEEGRKLADLPVHGGSSVARNNGVDVVAGIVSVDRSLKTLAPKMWVHDGSGQVREVVLADPGDAHEVRLSPDGRMLALARMRPDGQSQVELWRFDGTELRLAGRVGAPVGSGRPEFSPDGRLLAMPSPTSATTAVWDVSDPASPVHRADLPEQFAGTSRPMIKFSPDSRQVLLAAARTVTIWDLEQPDAPRRLAGFDNFTMDVMSADNWSSQFVISTGDGFFWHLRVDAEQAVQDLCPRHAELSDREWAKYFPDIERVPVC
ncbi:WD40-like Beta Propeller Repeat [Lentzea waywayandensis]|uniref:WD40-like Beta Propeller Repeat n=1 Tax=Lentzea waywayandensis TaxID=84724 RepID=A0A1I6FFG7_9PSEU|nr:helix-turn-helix domain-containing protein [Lentzea waywayandensis]SFR28668.1 WD40-like Beta Propeller Repeat [Lentzea waywayandensis]